MYCDKAGIALQTFLTVLLYLKTYCIPACPLKMKTLPRYETKKIQKISVRSSPVVLGCKIAGSDFDAMTAEGHTVQIYIRSIEYTL